MNIYIYAYVNAHKILGFVVLLGLGFGFESLLLNHIQVSHKFDNLREL